MKNIIFVFCSSLLLMAACTKSDTSPGGSQSKNVVSKTMISGRTLPTATRLQDGTVLITGGHGNTADSKSWLYLASAEIYDPSTGLWREVAPMIQARSGHAAILLHDGKVMILGGVQGSGHPPYPGPEIYDPHLNSWRAVAQMTEPRVRASATLLEDGRILVAGGSTDSGAISSAEIFDPSKNSWSSAGRLSQSRETHTATLLANGKVLVVGGFGASLSEIYDPVSNSWRRAANLPAGLAGHTATLLQNGKVLVAGGLSGSQANMTGQLYDPASDSWSQTGSVSASRSYHTATLLGDGRVLTAGGVGCQVSKDSSLEIYDPSTNAWSIAGKFSPTRCAQSATLLADGRVLYAGGENYDEARPTGSEYLSSFEIFDPKSIPKPGPSPQPNPPPRGEVTAHDFKGGDFTAASSDANACSVSVMIANDGSGTHLIALFKSPCGKAPVSFECTGSSCDDSGIMQIQIIDQDHFRLTDPMSGQPGYPANSSYSRQ